MEINRWTKFSTRQCYDLNVINSQVSGYDSRDFLSLMNGITKIKISNLFSSLLSIYVYKY